MNEPSPVMDLLHQGVPLSLLVDLAGFGVSSYELLLAERDPAELVPVAS